MSELLERVRLFSEARKNVERDFRAALVSASEHHSLREIGRAAGLSFTGVRYLLQREREDHKR